MTSKDVVLYKPPLCSFSMLSHLYMMWQLLQNTPRNLLPPFEFDNLPLVQAYRDCTSDAEEDSDDEYMTTEPSNDMPWNSKKLTKIEVLTIQLVLARIQLGSDSVVRESDEYNINPGDLTLITSKLSQREVDRGFFVRVRITRMKRKTVTFYKNKNYYARAFMLKARAEEKLRAERDRAAIKKMEATKARALARKMEKEETKKAKRRAWYLKRKLGQGQPSCSTKKETLKQAHQSKSPSLKRAQGKLKTRRKKPSPTKPIQNSVKHAHSPTQKERAEAKATKKARKKKTAPSYIMLREPPNYSTLQPSERSNLRTWRGWVEDGVTMLMPPKMCAPFAETQEKIKTKWISQGYGFAPTRKARGGSQQYIIGTRATFDIIKCQCVKVEKKKGQAREFADHIRGRHSPADSICPFCGTKWVNIEILKRHITSAHVSLELKA